MMRIAEFQMAPRMFTIGGFVEFHVSEGREEALEAFAKIIEKECKRASSAITSRDKPELKESTQGAG